MAEAALIGSTRLEALTIADAAAARGQSLTAATVARHRAEHRLRRYLTPTPAPAAPDTTAAGAVRDQRAGIGAGPQPSRAPTDDSVADAGLSGGDAEPRRRRIRTRRSRPRPWWSGDAAMSALHAPGPGPPGHPHRSDRCARTGSVMVLALAQSVGQVLDNLRNWLMGILAGLATLFLTLGGVRYVMAGGDPGEVERAKTAFRSAGIGYGLAALAPLVVAVLKQIVGA